jgi:phage terminase large subunit
MTAIHIGMDFNIDPMSAAIFQLHNNTVNFIDEIVIYSSNTDELVKEIKTRYPNRQIIVYPDPASRQRKTSAGGRTDLNILQNAGFTVRVKNAHPQIRDRINAVNSKLKNTNEQRMMFIDPKCKNIIRGLERHLYKEGTTQPDKDSGFDHMNDAIGYAVDYLFPIRKQYTKQLPQRWSVK